MTAVIGAAASPAHPAPWNRLREGRGGADLRRLAHRSNAGPSDGALRISVLEAPGRAAC